MSKRRRLTPFDPGGVPPLRPLHPQGAFPRKPGPIADVAGDASAHAALDALAGEVSAARAEGRMIEAIPLARIEPDHLIRDRIAVDADEMSALVESLRARGQQAPVEVVALEPGRYGLISGWRRLRALERLHAETGEDRFATALALVRAPESAAEAYLGMVEENEIRAGVPFYERARLAAEAARIGVHPDIAAAIAALYARASASRRSKIASFARLHDELGAHLRFAAAIPEKLGLALVGALQSDDAFGPRLRHALRHGAAADAAAERDILERALRTAPASKDASKGPRGAKGEEVAPGLFLEVGRGRAVLSGPGLDVRALKDWIAGRG